MEKLIDYRLFDPRNSIFKISSNERASFKTVYCSNGEKCDAFNNGQCTMFNMLTEKCPYGNMKSETGYTKRARGLSSWISSRKKLVDGICQLSTSNSNLFNCGDYIYFNYSHWYLGVDDEKYKGHHFGNRISYIEKKDFTVDFINKILKSRPYALMGGEITSYQKDTVPTILFALKTNMPNLTEELIEKYPEYNEKIKEISPIGRKVKANTIKIGCEYKFKRYGVAVWDGIHFIFNNYDTAFLPIKGEISAKIKPKDSELIKIQTEDQVCESTIFI